MVWGKFLMDSKEENQKKVETNDKKKKAQDKNKDEKEEVQVHNIGQFP